MSGSPVKSLFVILTVKDKAEVLVEVERLRGVQSELTAEVESLHAELERERSKNADPRAKDKVGYFSCITSLNSISSIKATRLSILFMRRRTIRPVNLTYNAAA